MCAILAKPPYNRSREEIGKMDPWWVVNVLFYPEDEKGSLLPMPGVRQGPWQSQKAFHWQFYENRGFPEWRIQELWDERKAKRLEAEKSENGRAKSHRRR